LAESHDECNEPYSLPDDFMISFVGSQLSSEVGYDGNVPA